MLVLDVETNDAWAAASTEIILDCVDVRPHASVNDHDSVYEPPHALCEPLMVPVTEPLIPHEPDSPLL